PRPRLARALDSREAGHAEDERESPVGPARVEQPHEAGGERVGELREPRRLVLTQAQLLAGRRDRGLRQEGPCGCKNLEGGERGERVTVTPRKPVPGRRRLVERDLQRALGRPLRIERGETPPECLRALRQEACSVGVDDALAEPEERRIGRRALADEEPCPVQLDTALQHLLEDPPIDPQRVEDLELPPLDEVPPSEALAHQTEGLLAHRDAARLDRAILETGVFTAELVERLTPEDEDPRPPVLDVFHFEYRRPATLGPRLAAVEGALRTPRRDPRRPRGGAGGHAGSGAP